VLDERPRGRGAELTSGLAALIRCLCCATVSVPMASGTVVRVRRAAITEVWGGGNTCAGRAHDDDADLCTYN
jgi:hypothetical protein